MARERTYLVIPAALIREHARPIEAKDRWRAWRRARAAEPELIDQDLVVLAPTQLLEIDSTRWTK